MSNIVVVFPKIENGKNIKNILAKNGFPVNVVCTTGAQALQYANELGDGIIICASRFQDMVYQELHGYLPSHFSMLLLATPSICDRKEAADIMCLPIPIKVHDLVETVETMVYSIARKQENQKYRVKKANGKRRSEAEKEIISKAKELLINRNNMTEEEAHRYIQKSSMDSGSNLVETAQMILSLMNRR